MLLTLFYRWTRRTRPYRLQSGCRVLRPAAADVHRVGRPRSAAIAARSVATGLVRVAGVAGGAVRATRVSGEVSRVG